jgi:glyoxylase-like metal-dependent hydrolase (beta-lactamase superfamily II)
MRIHHLTCPTLCPVSARLVNGAGALLGRGKMVCHCLLIEGARGLILVDTGIGAADFAAPERLGRLFAPLVGLRGGESALAAVERLGFRRADVRHLVVTHLDLDHAGGLPDFPEAEVHVFAAEHDAALSPRTLIERERYRPAHFAHGPRWMLHDGGGESWFGFDGVRALTDGAEVLLVPLAGHTRGHCGVAVRTRDGWLLHAGDAYFHHREMDERPTCTPALALFQRIVAIDDKLRRRNQARLRELVRAEPSVRVHSAHCPVEFDRFAPVEEA